MLISFWLNWDFERFIMKTKNNNSQSRNEIFKKLGKMITQKLNTKSNSQNSSLNGESLIFTDLDNMIHQFNKQSERNIAKGNPELIEKNSPIEEENYEGKSVLLKIIFQLFK
jgi:transcriptional/translational regulatory protein YebC/TACO1